MDEGVTAHARALELIEAAPFDEAIWPAAPSEIAQVAGGWGAQLAGSTADWRMMFDFGQAWFRKRWPTSNGTTAATPA